jgi:hypothetical protein
MTELLFGLTVIFVGYVIYEVFRTVSETYGGSPPARPAPRRIEDASTDLAAAPASEPAASSIPAEEPPAPGAAPAARSRRAGGRRSETPAEEPAPSAPAAAPTAAASATESAERGLYLRNPADGEVAPAPTNYRFAKKWIKDALVAEGLLDRVYKPNELDDAASRKVKDALEKFRHLEKYQA